MVDLLNRMENIQEFTDMVAYILMALQIACKVQPINEAYAQ